MDICYPFLIQSASMKYGRLTVIGTAKSIRRHRTVLCLCECGNKRTVTISALNLGTMKSCGCLRNEKSKLRMTAMNTTHGLSQIPEYNVWQSMKNRCYYPACSEYMLYGGRGIRVCDRWKNDFKAFISDMGRRPSTGHSIDRIDNDGNYDPKNCRWATRIEQQNNTSKNHLYEFNGRRLNLTQWAKEIGITPGTLHCRIYLRKWPLEKALTRGKWHKMFNHTIDGRPT